MDHTNISRYQNPPQQAQYSALSQLNSKQDYLDVFVIGVLHRLPIIYVLINITLLIWLAQTIISSKIQEIPKSAYLISPYFSQLPIKDIRVTSQQNCPELWQRVVLKSFPSITSQSFNHRLMYRWGLDGNKTFCIQRINLTSSIFKQNHQCSQERTLCNGFCFQSQNQCPITSIQLIKAESQRLRSNKRIFYSLEDGNRLVYSKKQGRPLVSLLATFRYKCSNDYRYFDTFANISQYQKVLTNCGNEGTINSFYDKIMQMKSETFMYYNNRPMRFSDLNLQQIQLGAVHELAFNNDTTEQCNQARKNAKVATDYLFNDPSQPLFTQSLLVIGFILMIAQIIWLMIYVCVNGYFNQKNIIVILICVIELTVISFIYSQNSKIFNMEQFIRSIANCIEIQVAAAATWKFGLKSSSAFTMIQYLGTIFLTLYFFAYLMDKFIFQPSSEIYRNFIYDDNNQRYSVLEDRVQQ